MNDLQRRQVEETQHREDRSKSSWAMMHAEAEAGRVTVFHIEDQKHARLHNLKEQVADLCDMQPTPANMLRQPRKVRAPPVVGTSSGCNGSANLPHLTTPNLPLCHTFPEMLSDLKKELAVALADVESELDAMGGSVSDMTSMKSGKTGKSAVTAKSAATATSVVRPGSAASTKSAVSFQSRKSAAP